MKLSSVPWLSEGSHTEQVDMQAQLFATLKVTDLCLHLFHMLLESVQYIAEFVAPEVLIAYTASGIHHYKDLLLLQRSAVLLPSSLPAAVHLPFCSHSAKAQEERSQSKPAKFYRVLCHIPSPCSLPLNKLLRHGFFVSVSYHSFLPALHHSQTWQMYQKTLTHRNRVDCIYNYSCLRSHCLMFPPALLTFWKLPRR